MHNLPEWKISREGKNTIIHFSLLEINICDVLVDIANNNTIKFYTDTIDFDMLEIIIQIANNKIDVATS